MIDWCDGHGCRSGGGGGGLEEITLPIIKVRDGLYYHPTIFQGQIKNKSYTLCTKISIILLSKVEKSEVYIKY